MNKQEFEKQAEALYTDVRSFLDNTFELIDKIDEPQKVVVPKEVAEWIECCKRSGWHLEKVLYRLDDDEKVGNWAYDENDDLIPEKVDMIARAWLDGFEIEQSYIVTDGNKLYLKEFDELNAIIIIDDVVGAVDYAKRYEDKTEAQQAADELGWIVKEVE
ncbi:TPA: DUF1642 domain-containing protein [Streptococcus suis]|nr:DUF1642 domain-containing protein [Streptococcus suis]